MKQSTAVNTSSLLLLCLSLAVLVSAVAGAKRNRQAPPPLTAVAKVTGSNGAVSGTIKFICSVGEKT